MCFLLVGHCWAYSSGRNLTELFWHHVMKSSVKLHWTTAQMFRVRAAENNSQSLPFTEHKLLEEKKKNSHHTRPACIWKQ